MLGTGWRAAPGSARSSAAAWTQSWPWAGDEAAKVPQRLSLLLMVLSLVQVLLLMWQVVLIMQLPGMLMLHKAVLWMQNAAGAR